MNLTAPFPPLAPPDLTPLIGRPSSTFRAGAYAVNLTAAMPRPSVRSPPLIGFLFRVEDMESQNITYLWQVLSHFVTCGYRENDFLLHSLPHFLIAKPRQPQFKLLYVVLHEGCFA